MARLHPDALPLTRTVLRVLVVLNLVAGFLILVLLVASLLAPTWVFTALGARPANAAMVAGMRTIMLLGIASVPLAHLVLSRLRAIVETVGEGDPFVAGNARRLQTIAWAVLGLEVMHLLVRAVAAGASSPGQPLDVGGSFSITGWLAVLLLLVLARVFERGAAMREELEGTV